MGIPLKQIKYIEHKYIDLCDWDNKNIKFDMKFDIIISNPPYNVGLLNRDIDICNTGNRIINAAARTRIDAAFVVSAYEKWLASDGYSIFVWPYSWTQLPSWKEFRNWIKCSGLKEIIAPTTKFDINAAAVNIAITIQQKNYSGEIKYNNQYRSIIPVKIDPKYDIIPNAIEQLGYDIFIKEYKFNPKINFINFKEFNKSIHKHVLLHATGYGLGDIATQISLRFKDLSKNTKNLIGPIKSDGFENVCNTPTMPVIIFDSDEHKERYKKYHKSNLYKFIIFQRKADFNNKKYNLGMIPDVCKNMVGEYTDKKAYDILGLSQVEIDHINKQFE